MNMGLRIMSSFEKLVIRPLNIGDRRAGFALVWETFLRFESPDYPPEGTETFRRTIMESASFHHRFKTGEQTMLGAYADGVLAGVLAYSIRGHVSLLFVRAEYQRHGIGRQLLEKLFQKLPEMGQTQITLNASPCGLPFYQRLGFLAIDTEQVTDGIRYTPMLLSLKKRQAAEESKTDFWADSNF